MTKAGLGFIVAGVFVYFLASQTQIGWLYLFDALIWGLLVMSAIMTWLNIRSLRVERQVLLPVSTLHQSQLDSPSEDEAVEVKLKVTNRGRLTRHFIKVLEDCPFDQPEARHRAFFLASINPQSTTAFSYTATCYRRGYYTSASTTLQSSGPLGLTVRRRTFPLPLNLTVYPAYYQVEGIPAANQAWADQGHAVRSSAAAEFYGSREYRYGDPLKHIHWRNTARLGNFMLKEFEQSSQGQVSVVLETGRDFGVGKETTLEYGIKIAASLARLGADSGYGIDIITGKTALYNAGWREAMDYLARLDVGGEVTLAELAAAPAMTQVCVAVVPAVETRLISILAQLADRASGLVVMLLEGFAQDEKPREFTAGLQGKNIEIISCTRGNLEAAIRKLSKTLVFGSRLSARIG
ncbi:MAG: DUF58 domain-containing protein [Dehalococcoidales bacterium]